LVYYYPNASGQPNASASNKERKLQPKLFTTLPQLRLWKFCEETGKQVKKK